MSAKTNHPSFRQPDSEECVIWRYLSFAKFADLVLNRRLCFSRVDRLGDPFEGTLTASNIEWLRKLGEEFLFKDIATERRELLLAQQISLHRSYASSTRRSAFVSCWHISEYESAAMWKLYGALGDVIALRTKYRILKNALPDVSYLGLCKYIDYRKESVDIGNLFNPVMHKRIEYAHERECRAVLMDVKQASDLTGQTSFMLPGVEVVGDHGVAVPINLSETVEEIVVAPTVQPGFVELVRVMMKDVSIPVSTSTLGDMPEP